jgi:hypothetical protein
MYIPCTPWNNADHTIKKHEKLNTGRETQVKRKTRESSEITLTSDEIIEINERNETITTKEGSRDTPDTGHRLCHNHEHTGDNKRQLDGRENSYGTTRTSQ